MYYHSMLSIVFRLHLEALYLYRMDNYVEVMNNWTLTNPYKINNFRNTWNTGGLTSKSKYCFCQVKPTIHYSILITYRKYFPLFIVLSVSDMYIWDILLVPSQPLSLRKRGRNVSSRRPNFWVDSYNVTKKNYKKISKCW